MLQLALGEACGGETSAKLLHSYTGLNIVQHQEIEHKEDLILWCFLFGRKSGLSGKRSLYSYLHIVMVQALLDSFDKCARSSFKQLLITSVQENKTKLYSIDVDLKSGEKTAIRA